MRPMTKLVGAAVGLAMGWYSTEAMWPSQGPPAASANPSERLCGFLDQLYGAPEGDPCLDPSEKPAIAVPSAAFETPIGIAIQGKIHEGDGRGFDKLLKRTTNPSTHTVTIMLDTPGGSLQDGLAMATAIFMARSRGTIVWAVVPPGAQCASSCISIFAAASARFVLRSPSQPYGQVLVHTVAIGGQESVASRSISIDWARMLARWGTPDTVIADLLLTSDRQAKALTPDELLQWDVKFKEVSK